MKKELGAESIFWAVEHLRRYRKGHEPVGRLQDSLDAIGFTTKTGLKPILVHEHKTANGWHLVFHLPPGISSKDIEDKRRVLEEQSGGEIDFELMGQNLHMDLSLVSLPVFIDYEGGEEPEEDFFLPVPLGIAKRGPLLIDLASKPHMLIGGNTGSGKTTALRVMAVSLLKAGAEVIIIDLKGGLDFACFRSHCLVVTTDEGALNVMNDLQKECKRRIPILEKAMVTSLMEYKGTDIPFIVLIIDEVAELESKESQMALNRLVRLSRSAGISVICATQRPSSSIFTSTVFSNTRMLFGGRLCFSVPKAEDSKMVLDNDSASRLPLNVPGRAIWQWAAQYQVQCYNLGLKQALELLETIPSKEGIRSVRHSKKLPPRPQNS